MTRIYLPDEDFHDVALQPEERVTLGAPADPDDVPLSRIALARPLPRRMDITAVDEDTRPFLEGNGSPSPPSASKIGRAHV